MRPLLLSGFMASGKTTVGRRAAELAGVAFEDLDQSIETRAGMPVAELFRTRGEAEFRELERIELERVLALGQPHVVALGGGALLDRARRLDALDRAVVVNLYASEDTLLARAPDDGARPLLAGDRPASARRLLEARGPGYAEAHGRVNTDVLDVDSAAQAVLAIWKRDPIAVALGERSYAVEVGHHVAAARVPEHLARATSGLIVSDTNVAALHLDGLREALGSQIATHLLEPGEAHKDVGALEGIWRALRDREVDRAGLIVAFGGGVVSDMAGLAAATWQRGTAWIALPTTLLAMVDASVGGKTAIDLGDAKNAVGAFWQPRAVTCDTEYLATEPERGFRSALAEVVKSALIGDPQLFGILERQSSAVCARDPELLGQVLRRCIAVKARIVSLDEREGGLRAVLNLGHTFGHGLEAATGYARYTHGEAVSLGMLAALGVGETLGVTPHALTSRVRALLQQLGLPTDLSAAPLADAASLVLRDKKRRGTYIHFVLAREVGRVETMRLEIAEVRRIAPLLVS